MGINLRRKKRGGKAELEGVLGNAEVPSFPAAVVKALEVLRGSDSSAADVAEALSVDPGLTVRLLKLVNSAGFGPARPISSIEQAVAIAGFGAVESLVLSVGITKTLPTVSAEGFDHARFWMAASLRAAMARVFAGALHPATASLSFTAGLLQDMAIPMLAANRADYSPVLVEWHNGGGDLHELERAAFGWSHDEVAGWLCNEWDLPEALRDAIASHHHPDDPEVPAAVRLAAPLREVEHPESMDAIIKRASDEFGLGTDRTLGLLEKAEAQATEVAVLFA